MIKIKRRLIRELDQVLDAIHPKLKPFIMNKCFIAGGAIASVYSGDPINDFDFYFRTEEDAREFLKLVSSYIGRDFIFNSYPHASGCLVGDLIGFNAIYACPENDLGVTWYSRAAITIGKCQFIIKYIGQPKQVVSAFDFQHCMGYFVPNTNELGLDLPTVDSIHQRELRYTGSNYPVSAMFRLRKYIKRGYSVTAGEMLKISYQISQLDLTDLNVLVDQLVGVDVSYFAYFVVLLKDATKEELQSFDYISNHIDMAFNRIEDDD
jgi:hypothetical protein